MVISILVLLRPFNGILRGPLFGSILGCWTIDYLGSSGKNEVEREPTELKESSRPKQEAKRGKKRISIIEKELRKKGETEKMVGLLLKSCGQLLIMNSKKKNALLYLRAEQKIKFQKKNLGGIFGIVGELRVFLSRG